MVRRTPNGADRSTLLPRADTLLRALTVELEADQEAAAPEILF